MGSPPQGRSRSAAAGALESHPGSVSLGGQFTDGTEMFCRGDGMRSRPAWALAALLATALLGGIGLLCVRLRP
jgi:hypothetical protein